MARRTGCSRAYSYDANGNMTSMPKGAGSMMMGYDVENRLSVAYGYEVYADGADNRRVYKRNTQTNDEQYFFWSGGQVLGIYTPALNGDNLTGFTTAKTYTYFGSRRLGERPDRLGSDVYNGTSPNKSYYPYGEEVTPTSGDGYKFATYYRDSATGLDYADQRYYAATIGRFLTPDLGPALIANPASWNRYSYAWNDPANANDPSGAIPTTLTCLDGFCPMGGSTRGFTAISVPVQLTYEHTFCRGWSDDLFCESWLATGWAYAPDIGDSPGEVLIAGKPIITPCTDAKKRFFTNLGVYQDVTKELGIDVNFIMALSVGESELFGAHAEELNNLFGLTKGGGNDLSFDSPAESGKLFVKTVKEWFAGTAVQTIGEFVDILLEHHYNVVDPDYKTKIVGGVLTQGQHKGRRTIGTYQSVLNAEEACKIDVQP